MSSSLLSPEQVETIVRWYTLFGCSGVRYDPLPPDFHPESSEVRIVAQLDVAIALAMCPFKIGKRTPVEHAIRAELKFEDAAREFMELGHQLEEAGAMKPSRVGKTYSPECDGELYAWRVCRVRMDMLQSTIDRARSSRFWRPSVCWLGRTFSGIAQNDVTFLPATLGQAE